MSESSHKNTLSLSTSRQAQAADATSSPLYISSTGSILRNMPVETPISIPVWTPQDEDTLRRSTYDDLRSVMNRLEALMFGCQQVLRTKYNEARGMLTKPETRGQDVQEVMQSRVMRRLAGESFDFSSAQEVRAEAEMIAVANEPTRRKRILSAAVEDLQSTTVAGTLVTNTEALKAFLANRDTVMTDAWCTRYVTAIRRLVVLYQSDPVYLRKHIAGTLARLVQYEVPYIVLLRASQGRLTEMMDITTQTPPLSKFASPNGSPHTKHIQPEEVAQKQKEARVHPKQVAEPIRKNMPADLIESDRTPSALEAPPPVERTATGSPLKRRNTPPRVRKQRPSNQRSSSPSVPQHQAQEEEVLQKDSIQPRDASQSPKPYPAPVVVSQRPPMPAPAPPTASPNRLTSNTFVVETRPRRVSGPASQEMPPCAAERTQVAPARSASVDKAGKSSTNETASADEPMYQRLAAEKAQNTNSAGRPVAPEYKRRTSLGIDSYFLPKSSTAAAAAAAPAPAAHRSASPESVRRRAVDTNPAPSSHLLVLRHQEQQQQLQQQQAAMTAAAAAGAGGNAPTEKECPAQRVERAPMSREQQLALYDDVPPFFIPPASPKTKETRQERVTSARGLTGTGGYRRGEVRSASPHGGAGSCASPTSGMEAEPSSVPRAVKTAPMPDTVIRRNRSRSPGARRVR